MNNLFPIGTVVRVGIGENLLMIITRLPLTIKDGQKGDYDYEDIVEVIFEGYVNPMEEKLQEYYHEKAPSITYPKFSIYD